MKPDFMGITAKLIAEVSTKTCIDTDVIEELLKDELIEYHNEIFTYGHNIGYDDGYKLGYDKGNSDGHSEGYSDGSY